MAKYRSLWCWSSLSLFEWFGSSNGDSSIRLWKNECLSGMQVWPYSTKSVLGWRSANLHAFVPPVFFAPYHEHAHSIYIDTILSYGVVGTVLLGIASSDPIRMLIDMSQVPSKTTYSWTLSFIFNSSCCTWNFWSGPLLDSSSFIFLLVMCSLPLKHSMIPELVD